MDVCHKLKKLLKDTPKDATIFCTGAITPYRVKRFKRNLKKDIRFFVHSDVRGACFKNPVVFVAFSEINKEIMLTASVFTAKILCFPPFKSNPIISSYNKMIDTVTFNELMKNISNLTIELESYQERQPVSNDKRYYGYGLIQHLEQLGD